MYEHYEYLTLTQIGKIFGLSNQKIGKILAKIGLRDKNVETGRLKPSKEAFDGGYCKMGPSRGDGYNWVWHREKTIG